MSLRKTTEQFKQEVAQLPHGGEYIIVGEYVDAHTKTTVKHLVCGNEYETTPSNLLSGRGCPYCSHRYHKTKAQFQHDVNKCDDGDEYVVLGEYVNNHTKIAMIHLACGTHYETSPHSFLCGHGRCPHCGKVSSTHQGYTTAEIHPGRLRTQEEFNRLIAKSPNANDYAVLSAYTNCSTRIVVQHMVCGNIYEVLPYNFVRGKGCPCCYGQPAKTTEQFKQEVRNLVGGEYEVVGEYKNSYTKIEVCHKSCGRVFRVRPQDFLQGLRCSYCFGREPHKWTPERIREAVVTSPCGSEYELIKTNADSLGNIVVRHLVCGKEFEVKAHRLLRGVYCPYCTEKSHGEQWIRKMLDEWGVGYRHEYYIKDVIPSSHTKNHGHRFDFYLPTSEIFIEFDGQQHFDPTQQFPSDKEGGFKKNRQYDTEINEYIRQHNLTCIRIKYTAMGRLDKIIRSVVDDDMDTLGNDPDVLIVNANTTKEAENTYYFVSKTTQPGT